MRNKKKLQYLILIYCASLKRDSDGSLKLPVPKNSNECK